MRIFTENNAFHNIQRCLNKQCKDVCQVEDFLQFCVQMIFYEKIDITSFVKQSIIDETNAIIELLSNEYKIVKVFDIPQIDGDTTDVVIDFVDRIVQNNIDDILEKCEGFYEKYPRYRENPLCLLPELDSNALKLIEFATKEIQKGNQQFFSDVLPMMPATDSGIIKIVSNEFTIDKICKFSAAGTWNISMTSYLIAKIRHLFSEHLAGALPGRVHAPSVIRGRMVQSGERLLRLIDEMIENLRRGKIDITDLA